MKDATMIRIERETRERLKEMGKLRDNYDTVINRALDCMLKAEFAS